MSLNDALQEVNKALQAGDAVRVIQWLQQLLSARPMTENLALQLSNAALAVHQPAISAQAMQLALQHQPNSVLSMNRLALSLKRLGRLSEAIDVYRQLLQRDPDNLEAQCSLCCTESYMRSRQATSKANQANQLTIMVDGAAPITLSVPDSALYWVAHYKYNIVQQAEHLYKQQSEMSDKKMHLLLYYICDFIALDWVMLRNHLPKHAANILNIGGGIGLFEFFLQQHYQGKCAHTLIELEQMQQVDHAYAGDHAYDLQQAIKVLATAGDIFAINGLSEKTRLVASTQAQLAGNQRYDMILSIRSLSFLYPLETYLQLILDTLSDEGTLILDVSKYNDDMSLIKQHFSQIKVLNGFSGATRVLCHR